MSNNICLENTMLKTVPKTKLREKTLERLRLAAEKAFTEKNYYNTSISDIVTGANASIGTFYNYFPDKISMYKYIVLKYGQDIRRYIATGLSKMQLASRVDMEREGVKLYFDYCIENPHVINIIWQSLFVAPELFIAYYDDFGKQYERQLSDAVLAGEVNPVNLEVASYVLMGASNFLAIKYVVFGHQKNINSNDLYAMVDDFMAILKQGLFAAQ